MTIRLIDQETGTEAVAYLRSHSSSGKAFPGLTLFLGLSGSSLPSDASTLLPSVSPLALVATALPAPQASLLFLLLLPVALALLALAVAWCLGWRRRRRQRWPCPGEQVSQQGGQKGWGGPRGVWSPSCPAVVDSLGAKVALPPVPRSTGSSG